MNGKFLKNFYTAVFLAILFLPVFVLADTEGQITKFFVEKTHDLAEREEIEAVLEKVSQKGYFYLENEWYENLTEGEKEIIDQSLETLGQEFDETIYPKLTSIYGFEWRPGIDNNSRVTILFHQMKEGVAGYFRSQDESPKLQSSDSNQREMLYLNANYLAYPLAKSFLAHEFVHLIVFNQKDRLRGVSEETWLNEALADYAPTLISYDADYEGSNLQKRVKVFIENPSDSLTGWKEERADYGVINVFLQYLVDQYGVGILVDSLQSSRVGVNAVEQVLLKDGIQKEFSDIFSDWAIAVLLNDCTIGRNYCYKNENLKELKIVPSLIYFPSTQRTAFSLDYSTEEWAGNWYRIMGGGENLKVTFQGDKAGKFKVAYVLCQNSQGCLVGSLELDDLQKGEISFGEFDKQYSSLTLIPIAEPKISGPDDSDILYNFSISAETVFQNNSEEKLIEELKARIAELQAQIAALQARIAEILQKKVSCQGFERNLYYGLTSQEVSCLQEFLASQKDIYPEGLITGFFGTLTQKAVIRFQEKYSSEILIPLGLTSGTGFVGPSTRAKINQIISL